MGQLDILLQKTNGNQPSTSTSTRGNLDYLLNTGIKVSQSQPISAPQPEKQPTFVEQVKPIATGIFEAGKEFIKQVPGYLKAAKEKPFATAVGAGTKLTTFFSGDIIGNIQQGIASVAKADIPERWDIKKQAKALEEFNKIYFEKKDIDSVKAFETGKFIGSFIPYAFGAEVAGLTIGAKVLIPTAIKFAPKLVPLVPRISNIIGFSGIGQLEYDKETDGTRVDRLKTDLVMLGLFEAGGVLAKGLSKMTSKLVSKTYNEISTKIKSGKQVEIASIEKPIADTKVAIQKDTGKPAPVVLAENITKASDKEIKVITPKSDIQALSELEQKMKANRIFWQDIEKSLGRKLDEGKPLDIRLALNKVNQMIKIEVPQPKGVKFTKPIKEIPKELEPLAQEARKYKTFQEFTDQSLPISRALSDIATYGDVTKNYRLVEISIKNIKGVRATSAIEKIPKFTEAMRKGDVFPPIILNEKNVIQEGGHRIGAFEAQGKKTISALVPVGKGRGEIVNLQDFYTQATGGVEPKGVKVKPTEIVKEEIIKTEAKGKPPFSSSEAKAVQETFANELHRININVSSESELIKQSGRVIDTAIKQLKEDRVGLAGLRTALNKELFSFAGVTGNYKQAYAELRTLFDDPSIGKYLSHLDSKIANIDNLIKKAPAITKVITKQVEKRITERKIPQPIGTGEARISRLALGVEARVTQRRLTATLGELPEFKQVSMKDQAERASKLLIKDFDRAVDIAMGKRMPPTDILPESVFIAVENKAIKDNNMELLRQLANSIRTTEATAMGQRIRTLAERYKDSPVKIISDIIEERQKTFKIRYGGKTSEEVRNRVIRDIQRKVKTPDKYDWNNFIQSLPTC